MIDGVRRGLSRLRQIARWCVGGRSRLWLSHLEALINSDSKRIFSRWVKTEWTLIVSIGECTIQSTNSLMTPLYECLNRASHVCFSSSQTMQAKLQLILISLLVCMWDKRTLRRSHTNPFLSSQKSNDTINNPNNRAMDACEIANFLASELFMHQVSRRLRQWLEVLILNLHRPIYSYRNSLLFFAVRKWRRLQQWNEWHQRCPNTNDIDAYAHDTKKHRTGKLDREK